MGLKKSTSIFTTPSCGAPSAPRPPSRAPTPRAAAETLERRRAHSAPALKDADADDDAPAAAR